MKILVAHRQETIVAAIKSVLSGCNPVIRNTESGLDGLLTSRIERFDLIICGTDLPVVTGFELVRSIRTHSVNRNTPVIFISDETNDKIEHLANALDVAGMLTPQDISSKLSDLVVSNIKTRQDDISVITGARLN